MVRTDLVLLNSTDDLRFYHVYMDAYRSVSSLTPVVVVPAVPTRRYRTFNMLIVWDCRATTFPVTVDYGPFNCCNCAIADCDTTFVGTVRDACDHTVTYRATAVALPTTAAGTGRTVCYLRVFVFSFFRYG
jgi:hypothetical protein